MKKIKRALALLLSLAMCFALCACGGTGSQDPDTSQAPGQSQPENSQSQPENSPATPNDASEPPASEAKGNPNANYKGKTTYADIAEQLRADTTLDLNGLESDIFKITGYAQGYNFDEAWFGSIAQMVNSGAQVMLMSGSSQFPFNFGGLPRTSAETDIHVGGVDSLTAEFSDLLAGGVYDFCSGSYPSMIGPTIALILRDLEGNKLTDASGNSPAVTMSHAIVNSADELQEVLAEDAPGSYAYNAGVISTLMSADYDTFMGMISNVQWDQVKANKAAHSGDAVATLSKEYKIGLLRNDVTSDEALAYEGYLTELAKDMGFSITFSESTEGNATNEVNQIDTWAAAGFDAVISMSSGSSYDQAEACNSHGMKYVQYAAQPEDDDLMDLETLDSYLGAVGPGRYNEGEAGYRLAKYYIDNGYTDFAVFGGSIMFGAEQHAYRVGGMIAAMIEYETGVPNTDFN